MKIISVHRDHLSFDPTVKLFPHFLQLQRHHPFYFPYLEWLLILRTIFNGNRWKRVNGKHSKKMHLTIHWKRRKGKENFERFSSSKIILYLCENTKESFLWQRTICRRINASFSPTPYDVLRSMLQKRVSIENTSERLMETDGLHRSILPIRISYWTIFSGLSMRLASLLFSSTRPTIAGICILPTGPVADQG